MPTDSGVFPLGDLAVEAGGVLRDARLAWRTHGTLAADGSNVVVYPTSYGATSADLGWLVHADGVLDPTRWFVVVVDNFSNGVSSSAADDPDYPALVTTADVVRAQRRLLTEHFDVDRLAAVYGFSMGGQQAYHWASLFPDAVERAVVVCGSARTSPHNRVFLSGLMRILEAAPEHVGGGRFSAEPRAALRAFAHVYAGWALSQDWYRAEEHRGLPGAPDLDAYLLESWERRYDTRRAANLYAQLRMWSASDIGGGGDLAAALARVTARVLLLPSATDLYFRVADNEAELAHLRSGELRVVPSTWGHLAGNPTASPADAAFLRTAVRAWLDA